MSFALGLEIGLLLGKKKFGGSAEPSDDWQPPGDWPYIPEPGDYEVTMLVEIIADESGKTDIGFRFDTAVMFQDTNGNWKATTAIGPIKIDWGDGTTTFAEGNDFNEWNYGNGTYDANAWRDETGGYLNSHKYNTPGQYIVKVTTNEHSNFLKSLYNNGNVGKAYTLIIKCGAKIIVGVDPNATTGLDDTGWFKNGRLQYIKYKGEGANFPNIYFANALKKIEAISPHIEIARPSFSRGLLSQNYYITNFDFSECKKITNVNFINCGFKKINLPKCEEINSGSFSNCKSLTEISAPLLKNIPALFCSDCSNLKKIDIPLCETIERRAFANCYNLENVNLPNCISVGDNAFAYCYNLSKIYLPECTTIGSSAFNYCTKVTEVYAPKCKSVGSNAFGYCYNLQKVTFADGCTFGANVFYNCNALYPIPT